MKKNTIIGLLVAILTVFINVYPVLGDYDSEVEKSVYKPLPGENENTFIDNPSTLKGNDAVYQKLPGEPGDSFNNKGKLKDEGATQEYDSDSGFLPGEEIKSFDKDGKLVDEGSTKEENSVSRALPGPESEKDYNLNGKLAEENATDDKSVPPTYSD
jgi:hypothetical protein